MFRALRRNMNLSRNQEFDIQLYIPENQISSQAKMYVIINKLFIPFPTGDTPLYEYKGSTRR